MDRYIVTSKNCRQKKAPIMHPHACHFHFWTQFNAGSGPLPLFASVKRESLALNCTLLGHIS